MHIDRHLTCVLDQLEAGTRVSYVLHFDVRGGELSGAHEYTLRNLICHFIRGATDNEYEVNLSPRFPVPFSIPWMMPSASPTCNMFYAVDVHHALTGSLVSEQAGLMLKQIEARCKDLHREMGTDWYIPFYVCAIVQRPDWWSPPVISDEELRTI